MMNIPEYTGKYKSLTITDGDIEENLKRNNYYHLNVLFIDNSDWNLSDNNSDNHSDSETITKIIFNIYRWYPCDIIVKNNSETIEHYLYNHGYQQINQKHYQRSRYEKFHGERFNGIEVDSTLKSYFPDYNYIGVFIDVGAYHPYFINNSYHFERNGWSVFCLEANTNLIPELKKYRKNVYNYAVYDSDKDLVEFNVVYGPWGCENGEIGTAGCSAIELNGQYMEQFSSQIQKIEKIQVPQITLNTFLKTLKGITNIDILKIDVEGGELKVLKGIDLEKYQPRIILVEDIFDNEEMHNYLIMHGYILDKKIEYNKYYLRSAAAIDDEPTMKIISLTNP